jgi:hypothetical protein
MPQGKHELQHIMEVVTPCAPEVLAYDVPLMERVMWS